MAKQQFENLPVEEQMVLKYMLSKSNTGRVCGKNLNIVSMCAVSPVVHISNIS